MTTIDRSNYLKGLLILAKQDNKLVDSERNFIRTIAKDLGFSKDFYEETLRNLMANKYLKNDAFKFSSVEVAESFIKDGLKLALSDNTLAGNELSWLKQMAQTNSIADEKFEEFIKELDSQSKITPQD